MKELTISQARERLGQRGIEVARRTVASWAEQGLLPSRVVESPTGSYRVIPAGAVETFVRPAAGRPPKNAAKKAAARRKEAA